MTPSTEELIKQAIATLRGPDGKATSREAALTITKLEEALLWLLYGGKLK